MVAYEERFTILTYGSFWYYQAAIWLKIVHFKTVQARATFITVDFEPLFYCYVTSYYYLLELIN